MLVRSLILIRRIGVMARDCCPSAIRNGETTRSAATVAHVEPRTTHDRPVGRTGRRKRHRPALYAGSCEGEMLTSRSWAVTPSASEQRLGGSDVDAMVMVTTARRGRDARDCSARSRHLRLPRGARASRFGRAGTDATGSGAETAERQPLARRKHEPCWPGAPDRTDTRSPP